MKNKKAAMPFNMIIVVMTAVILVYAWAQLNYKYNSFNEIIGEKQYKLLAAYNKGENALLYIDLSAKYSLQQAVYDLAKSGGIQEISDISLDEPSATWECGEYYGTNVWLEVKKSDGKYNEKECFDESSARNNLKYGFDKKLNQFLANYPEKIPTSNYDYEIKGNLEVLGIAKEQMKIDIIGKIKQDSTKKGESAKIGEYSIKPSFRAEIDYNIDEEYGSLKYKAKQIIEECKAQDMEKCLKEKSTEIGWNCEETEKDVLYDFIHKLDDCINYNGREILCKFSFDKKEFLNKVKSERNFEIKLSNSPGRVKAEMFEDGKLIATDFINIKKLAYTDNVKYEGKDVNSITIKVKYSDGNPIVEEAYASTPESAKLDLSRTFHIYKKNENVNFIDLSVEGLFRASVPSINLPVTKGIKFCAKTGKQIFAYDESDKAAKLRDLDYRFSITFPKSPPIPIQKLEAFDALKSENSAILVWDKPKDEIDSYSIYSSEKNFADIKIENIIKDGDIKKVNIGFNNKIDIESIDLKNCNIEVLGNPCKYSIYGNLLQFNKLYYWKSKDKYFYVLRDVLDEKEHSFAVVAVNNAGQLDNDKSIEGNTYVLSEGGNFIKFLPVDDLAPSKVTELNKIKTPDGKTKITWKRPSKNIDGSNSNDLTGYKIYFKKSLSAIIPQLEPGHQVKQITSADAKCDTISLYCEYFIENIANLEKGQFYNFAVTAIDEKGNEYNLESERVSVQID